MSIDARVRRRTDAPASPGVVHHGLDLWQIETLVRAGVAAPSMHNTQPWKIHVSSRTIDVGLDARRLLPHEDPTSRAAHVSSGAVVLNISAAGAAMGLHPTVGWMPDDSLLELPVARVRLDPTDDPDRDLAALAAQIPRRRTYRATMGSRDVADGVRARLTEVADAHGTSLRHLDDVGRRVVDRAVRAAQVSDGLDPGRTRERLAWTAPDGAASGVPRSSLGPHPLGSGIVVREFTRTEDDALGWARFEPSPDLSLLCTGEDTSRDWLDAGVALEETWLTATRYGVSMSFLNQPLEHTETREVVRELADGQWPQMIVRLGYGGLVAPTPRRPWRSFLRRRP